MKSFSFLLILLFFFSCKKEKFTPSWVEHHSPTKLTLNSIYFTNDSTGHIVGGDSWATGIYLKTNDAGKTWTIDSLGTKEIFNLYFNESGYGFAVGLGGDFYFKASPQSDWQRPNLFFPFETFRGVSFWKKESGVIVTGGAFQGGKILQVNDNFEAVVVDSFEQELATVFHSEKNIVHAAGYGIVLRSTDGGNTWKNKGIIGDFFKDIYFPTPQVGYAVGHSGSIIKTTDAGNSWNFIRNGDKISTSNELFRAVFFTTENKGYIVGDRGLFWKTENGGDDWKVAEDMPDVDLYDIFVANGTGFIVGKSGRIFSFEE